MRRVFLALFLCLIAYAPALAKQPAVKPAPGPPQSLPVLSAISPNSAVAGSPAVTMVATGAKFISASVVRWGSANLATSFISSSQLRAVVPSGYLANPGIFWVSVLTSGKKGGSSQALEFTVTPSPPPLPPPSSGLLIWTAWLAPMKVGVDYWQTIEASGGTPPYTFTVDSLPPGLVLSNPNGQWPGDPPYSVGLITGTPSTAGNYAFTVTVTDSSAPAQMAKAKMQIKDLSKPRMAGQKPLVPVMVQIHDLVAKLPDDQVLSIPEIAQHIGVWRQSIRDQANRAINEGLAIKLGSRIFFGSPAGLRNLQAAVRRQLENR